MSKTKFSLLFAFTTGFTVNSFSYAQMIQNPAISVVLDGYYQKEERELGHRSKGYGLGETELSLSSSIDDLFYGKLTTVFEADAETTEIELEEAFVQTLSLPAGFSMRGGRFLSDIGYLNEQHLHTDSFVERPLAYRAFLGDHYFDDGVRLAYVLPTSFYWQVALESFKGNKLRAEDEAGNRAFKTFGVYTFNSRFGGDIGQSNSWQLGLSFLKNQNGRQSEHEHNNSGNNTAHEDDHSHNHSAAFTGKNTLIVDAVYKWAPDGNYKYNHLTLSGEYFNVQEILPEDEHSPYEDYNSWYISGVYQVSPQWSAGVRYGELTTFSEEAGEFEQEKHQEADVMLSWHHSHFSTVRLQYSWQSVSHHDEHDIPENVFTLQYVMTLGAHNAHQF